MTSHTICKLGFVLAIASPIAAHAQPTSRPVRAIAGATAKNLIRTIKYAGVKPTVGKDRWTYKVAVLECTEIDEGNTEDGLDAGSCALDKIQLKDDAALALAATLAPLATGEAGAGHSTTRVTGVVCTVDTGKGKWVYACTYAL